MHMNGIIEFFTKQILGMKWLQDLWQSLLEVLGVPLGQGTDWQTMLGNSAHFFLYDITKILIMLSLFVFAISYVQSYYPPERSKRILGKFKGMKGNIIGALLGTVTPFCSCSSIPLFIGFTQAGLPIGTTFSFLISSPLVDLAAVIILSSIFGLKITLAYVLVGVVLAVVCGSIISKLRMERYIEDYITQPVTCSCKNESTPPTCDGETDEEEVVLTRKQRAKFAFDRMKGIVGRVWVYVIIGVAVGALIHNVIPQNFINNILGQNNAFGVLIATLVGIPMYADEFGMIPVAEALFLKKVPIGTILSLMMAVTALSVPSLILLRKVVKPKLLFLFVGLVTVGIIIIGYAFNVIGPWLVS